MSNPLMFDGLQHAWVETAGLDIGCRLALVDDALAGLCTLTTMLTGQINEREQATSGNENAVPLTAGQEESICRASKVLAKLAADELGRLQDWMGSEKEDAISRTGQAHKWALVPCDLAAKGRTS